MSLLFNVTARWLVVGGSARTARCPLIEWMIDDERTRCTRAVATANDRGYRRFVTIQSACMKALCVLFTACILRSWRSSRSICWPKGFSYLSWDIFTEVPIPPGMEGAPGGLKNALVGTGILIALASAVGIPLGVLAGIYLSEYSARSWLAAPAAVYRRRADGRAVDRGRHSRLRVVCRADGRL